jgi:hypothetical protein
VSASFVSLGGVDSSLGDRHDGREEHRDVGGSELGDGNACASELSKSGVLVSLIPASDQTGAPSIFPPARSRSGPSGTWATTLVPPLAES